VIDDDEYEEVFLASNGMPGKAIAEEGRKAFLRVMCQEVTEPTPAILDKWMDCVGTVLTLCDLETTMPWQGVAQRLAYQFYRSDRWGALASGQRLAWEAAARAMVSWATLEDTDDRRAAERFDWEAWAVKRLTQEHEPEEHDDDDES
jgi:hypothetical protein